MITNTIIAVGFGFFYEALLNWLVPFGPKITN